ncbi:MAG: endolytic transglycosylase MltG [Parolsenella sp.]|uniref:endolytic transglycosylase MltG n=1 Tax=Parolsenella sp. TaxID=2083006 RepID=UPI002E75C161|nr:endolytic transglycosylase MltG [Parolsenella sp.]MEE1373375.1 endolytic transglycosylase MltG [Parolsenella sp.]
MADSQRRRRGSHFSSDAAPSGARRASRPTGSGSQVSPYAAGSRPAASSRVAGARPTAARSSRPAAARSARPANAGRRSSATGLQALATPRTRSQRAASARGGHSHKGPVLAAVIVLIAIVVAGVVFVPRLLKRPSQEDLPNQGMQVEVVIDDGSGAIAIGSKLEDAGVIASSDDFVAEVRKQGADSSLKSGAYMFTVGQSFDSIIDQLVSGPNSTSGAFTIPEGLTVSQAATVVSQTFSSISSDDFLAQAKASNYVADYPFLADAQDDSLEGFLCPKTYNFSGKSNVTADDVIRAMLDQYKSDVMSLDFDSAKSLIKDRYGIDMSDYDFLKLASVIEREAVTDSQRPKVSSTFYNRLKIGMPLQSDATMMYVTGGEVTADDLKQESPYNTYLNNGLTPTPICSPSIDSIKAALSPDETDYLYFYITQTDEWFSATYDEHLQAIEANR